MKLTKILPFAILLAAATTVPALAQDGGFERSLQVSGPVNLFHSPIQSLFSSVIAANE